MEEYLYSLVRDNALFQTKYAYLNENLWFKEDLLKYYGQNGRYMRELLSTLPNRTNLFGFAGQELRYVDPKWLCDLFERALLEDRYHMLALCNKQYFRLDGLLIVSTHHENLLLDVLVTREHLSHNDIPKGMGLFLFCLLLYWCTDPLVSKSNPAQSIVLQVAGCSQFTIGTPLSNTEACIFYEKLGFGQCSTDIIDGLDKNLFTMCLSIRNYHTEMVEQMLLGKHQFPLSLKTAEFAAKINSAHKTAATDRDRQKIIRWTKDQPEINAKPKQMMVKNRKNKGEKLSEPKNNNNIDNNNSIKKRKRCKSYVTGVIQMIESILAEHGPLTVMEIFNYLKKAPYHFRFNGNTPKNTLSCILTNLCRPSCKYNHSIKRIKNPIVERSRFLFIRTEERTALSC